MIYTTVELSKKFEHRYKFNAGLYHLRFREYKGVVVFLDTGCFNTLIPRFHAEQSGRSLGFWREYRLGGRVIEAEAFSINKIMIGDFVLNRVLAFAANYSGEYENEILLGTNVMNNWEMIIHKDSHTFKFREVPPQSLPNNGRKPVLSVASKQKNER